jgi:hypothetical protein
LDNPRRRWNSLTTGMASTLAFGLALVLAVVVVGGLAVWQEEESELANAGAWLALFVGATQLPVVVPLAAFAFFRGYRRTAAGLLIGAGIVIFLDFLFFFVAGLT